MFQEGEVVTCAPQDRASKQSDKPEHEGLWHVLSVEPQHEGVAFAHLVARRFGAYLPEIITTEVIRGREHDVHRPMFRGYLFILVFGFEAHWRRIFACPGVTGVLMNGGHPAIVPDAAMRIIQAEEAGLGNEIDIGPKPKKRWRRIPKAIKAEREAKLDVRITTYSVLKSISTLDDSGRVGALHKALGLALQRP